MDLVCLTCRSPLLPTPTALECRRCSRSWPLVGGVPLLVEEPAAYIRGALARFHADRFRPFDLFARAVTSVQGGSAHPAPEQMQRMDQLAGAVRHNYALFETLLSGLQALLPADARPLDGADLDYPTGYGPEAASEFLLRDWRKDSPEGLEWASAVLPAQRVGRAVVLGSGAGRTLSLLADRCDEVVGIDLSFTLASAANRILQGETLPLYEVRLQNARSMSDRVWGHELSSGREKLANVSTVVADALKTPLADGAADWVVAAFLFDVVPDGRALLREARRLVRPGGAFVLLTVFNYQHDDLWTYYAPEQVPGMLEEEGFQVREALWVESSHLASPRSIKASRYQALRVLAGG